MTGSTKTLSDTLMGLMDAFEFSSRAASTTEQQLKNVMELIQSYMGDKDGEGAWMDSWEEVDDVYDMSSSFVMMNVTSLFFTSCIEFM